MIEVEETSVETTTPPPAPTIEAFFTGDWAGNRNNYNGEVGLDILANQVFTITHLGRHADAGSLSGYPLPGRYTPPMNVANSPCAWVAAKLLESNQLSGIPEVHCWESLYSSPADTVTGDANSAKA